MPLFLMVNICMFLSCSNSGKVVIGSAAPELSLPDLNGDTLTLSSLKGKPVLVHFWASWCKPCREENPELVVVYNKFKDDFVIYSISLDEREEQWLAAIKKDKLDWNTHVSDLKGMNSAAAETYEVNYIPSSFLIDKDGFVIANDLKPEELERALDEIVKKMSSLNE